MLRDNLPAEFNRSIELTDAATDSTLKLAEDHRATCPKAPRLDGSEEESLHGWQNKKAFAHGEEAKATERTQCRAPPPTTGPGFPGPGSTAELPAAAAAPLSVQHTQQGTEQTHG